MKNSLMKLYLLVFFLLSDFIVFAQDGEGGPGDTGDGDLEGDDPSAPINSKIIILAIVGIAFAYYYFSSRRQQKING